LKKIPAALIHYWRSGELRKPDWWVLGGLALAFAFLVMEFTDFTLTVKYGETLLEAIAEGRFFDYYRFVADSAVGNAGGQAIYQVPFYLTVAILTLPAFIAQYFFAFDITGALAGLLYLKLMLVALMGVQSFLVYRICLKAGGEKRTALLAAFLTATAGLVLMNIGLGRWDILAGIPGLLMVEAAIEGKQWRFLVYAAIGVVFKNFTLFLFIPLLLYREKSFVKIALKLAAAISGVIICQALFFRNPEAASLSRAWLEVITWNILASHSFPIWDTNASLFVASYAAVCLYAFMSEPSPDRGQNHRQMLYLCFLSLLPLILFTSFHFNWGVIICPFIILVAISSGSPEKYKLNLALDTLFNTVIVIVELWYSRIWVPFPMFGGLLLQGAMPANRAYQTMLQFLWGEFGISGAMADGVRVVLGGVLLISALGLAAINFPGRREKEGKEVPLEDTGHFPQRGLILLRSAALLPFMLLMFMGARIPYEAEYLLFETARDSWAAQVPLAPDTQYTQALSFPEDNTLSKLSLYFHTDNTDDRKNDNTTALISIKETRENAVLYTVSQVMNLVSNIGEGVGCITLDLGELPVAGGVTYEITISGKWGTWRWYPYLSDNPIPAYPLSINGELYSGMLSMQILGKNPIYAQKAYDAAVTRMDFAEGQLEASVHNSGTALWTDAQLVSLRIFVNGEDRGERGTIRGAVKPGEACTFTIPLDVLPGDRIDAIMLKSGEFEFGNRMTIEVNR
jgi:hypothetical protein